MAKQKRGMIEIINEFYKTASPDSAEMITRHAVACNKIVQAANGKATAAPRTRKPKVDKVEPVPEASNATN
jgi:hypothetical protein